VLLALAALALVMGIFYSASHGTQAVNASVTFTPVSLDSPDDILLVHPSALPNELLAHGHAVIVNEQYRWDVMRVTVKSTSAIVSVFFSNEEGKMRFPIFITEDGSVLLSYHKMPLDKSKSIRENLGLSLRDPKLERETDITPNNLPQIMKSLAPTDYENELFDKNRGVVQYAWKSSQRVMSVWHGNKMLEKAGECENVVAKVDLYVEGRFTYGAITQDGKVVVYDPSTGTLTSISGYETIAKAAVTAIRQAGDRTPEFVIAKGIAAFERSGSLTVFLSNGKSWSRRLPSSNDYRPNGRKRPAKESNAISFLMADKLVREEAKHLPPDYMSSNSQLIAFNDNSIALYDNFYQRLVVITPKG
jgi:hypothetical protein